MKSKRIFFNFMLFFTFSYVIGIVFDFLRNLVINGQISINGEKYLLYAVLLSIGLAFMKSVHQLAGVEQ
jgi:hypothetical protein